MWRECVVRFGAVAFDVGVGRGEELGGVCVEVIFLFICVCVCLYLLLG